jgi:menaquinol-cytochrome c reductase iron-sulfur subunit
MNSDNEKVKKTLSRRNFFKIISGLFTGFITVTLGIPMLESLLGTTGKKKHRVYSKIAPVSSIQVEKPVDLPFVMTVEDAFIKNVEPENVWAVKNSDSETTVFSPICPHLGCRYQWHESKKLFICPCHHSVFNIEGKVVSGPAPRPLDTLPSKIKNNYLYALWERFKPGIPTKEIL